MYKVRILLTLENEEQFINKYAKRGYSLKYIAPFRLMPPLEFRVYKFNVAKDDSNIYKIDNRTFNDKTDEQEYMQLMADDGWHFFKDNYTYDSWYPNYYWYKKRISGAEEIYSDEDSKLEASDRMFSRLLMFAVLLLGVSILFPTTNSTDSSQSIMALLLSNWYLFGLLLISGISLLGKFIIFIKRKINALV